MKLETLRKKYPKFLFEDFGFNTVKNGIEIFFKFKIEPNIKFSPKIFIEGVSENELAKIKENNLKNLVFNLGLIEILSYWKATCSQKIEILAGKLTQRQIEWWRDIILRGMGQFFFENKINFLQNNFLQIETKGEKFQRFDGKLDKEKVLIPVGGGKDSIVTIEYLKKTKKDLTLFFLNPKKHQLKIAKISKIKNAICVKREIDRKLIELNKRGFLNGHTPFTAYLSFLTVLVAVLKNYKFIAFSNEKSSNEGNVKYGGMVINHQYSKSEDFEERFRFYSKKYLAKEVEYFSLLRPFYELEIAALFSQFPQYFNTFLSCNVAFQTKGGVKKPLGRWCGQCPKCLFTFVSLYPFVGKKVIKIFKKNLFDDKKLLPLLYQLLGLEGFKPFECVGTKKETLLAFKLSLERCKKEYKKLPFLLENFAKIIGFSQ